MSNVNRALSIKFCDSIFYIHRKSRNYETECIILSRGLGPRLDGWTYFAGFMTCRSGAVIRHYDEAAHSGHQSAKI